MAIYQPCLFESAHIELIVQELSSLAHIILRLASETPNLFSEIKVRRFHHNL